MKNKKERFATIKNEIEGLISTLIGLTTDRRSSIAKSRKKRFTGTLLAIFEKRLEQALANERKRIVDELESKYYDFEATPVAYKDDILAIINKEE